MTLYRGPIKLADCKQHGPGAKNELFIVEGDSASKAVCAVRNVQSQAVLPMQGKPINAMKAKLPTILRYDLFRAVFDALGYPDGKVEDTSHCRFERVILLFDPDADGIHCGALMLMFFYRVLRPLLEEGRICIVRAPLYELRLENAGIEDPQAKYAYTQDEALKLIDDLQFIGINVKRIRYRGLANMREQTLLATCLDPATRKLNRLQIADAEAAIAVFGGVAANR